MGDEPEAAAFDYLNGCLYVPNLFSRSVSVISAARHAVIATIGVPIYPASATFDGLNGAIYLTSGFADTSMIAISGKTNSVVATVPVGYNSAAPVVDYANGNVYVANAGSADVTVVSGSTNSVIGTVSVGGEPESPAYDSSNADLYVPDATSNAVSVISTSSNWVIATIPVGNSPGTPVYDNESGNLFVPNGGSDSMSVISGAANRVVATILLGASPLIPALDPKDHEVYVPDVSPGNVTVISTRTFAVVAQVAVGGPYPGTPRYDPADGDIYVPTWTGGSGPSNVTAINGSTHAVAATILVGGDPATPTFDAETGELYVSNRYSWSVSVIDGGVVIPPTFTVSFWARGLPNGASWSVTLDGYTNTSQSNPIEFSITNGTDLVFTIGLVAEYAATPSAGFLTVWGAGVSELITFTQTGFPLWFNETGLPNGSSWSVTVVGTGNSSGMASVNSSLPSALIYVAAGFTGLFMVPSVGGFLPSPPSGPVEMPDPAVPLTVAINFSALPPPGPSVVSFSVIPPTLTLGASSTFEVRTRNGELPLAFYYLDLPAGCVSKDTANLTCTPSASGFSTVLVIVSDRIGRTAEANATLSVSSATGAGSTGGGFLGLPPTEGYAVLAWLAAAVFAATGVALWWRRRLTIMSRTPARVPALGRATRAGRDRNSYT